MADAFDLTARNAELAVPLRGRRRGRVERAVAALPAPAPLIPAARAWLARNRPEIGDETSIAQNLTDAEVMGAMQVHYPNGGWTRFVLDRSGMTPLTHVRSVEGTPTWVEVMTWAIDD